MTKGNMTTKEIFTKLQKEYPEAKEIRCSHDFCREKDGSTREWNTATIDGRFSCTSGSHSQEGMFSDLRKSIPTLEQKLEKAKARAVEAQDEALALEAALRVKAGNAAERAKA